MVACEVSRAREHGHDSKQEHQVERPIIQERSGREHLGGATSGACGHKGHEGEMIVLEENRAREGLAATKAGRPKPAGLPYKRHLPVPVFCRQVALSFLHLCPQVFESRTTIDIAILPELDCSNNSHP
jgi:hypothetical protein